MLRRDICNPHMGILLSNSCPRDCEFSARADFGYRRGHGLFVEAAGRWGLDCQGIEGSEDAIAIGQKRYAGLRLSRQYLSAPFPFDGEQFQTVLLHQVIAHLEPEVARHVLAEASRVMRRGGLILIFSPGRFNKTVRRNSPACETWGQMYAPGELRALLTSAGFQNVVQLDRPRELLGGSFLGRLAMRAALRLTHWDRLSATANCQASKPRPLPADAAPSILP